MDSTTIYFKQYDDTGEVSYTHPFTGKEIFLEDDQEMQDIIDGWEQHWTDEGDNAWHDREEM